VYKHTELFFKVLQHKTLLQKTGFT